MLEKKYANFNAGKTNFNDHREYLFITEVINEKYIRSPLFYVGDKYKIQIK